MMSLRRPLWRACQRLSSGIYSGTRSLSPIRRSECLAAERSKQSHCPRSLPGRRDISQTLSHPLRRAEGLTSSLARESVGRSEVVFLAARGWPMRYWLNRLGGATRRGEPSDLLRILRTRPGPTTTSCVTTQYVLLSMHG